ncbi:hypothetical protein [Nonomuraea sp. NPDC050540]|uniref:hypothetical protein n=1 Tax=Nonomuraea sp. NPDC050540 TaxID=3364367 RepID=UPI0037B9D65B
MPISGIGRGRAEIVEGHALLAGIEHVPAEAEAERSPVVRHRQVGLPRQTLHGAEPVLGEELDRPGLEAQAQVQGLEEMSTGDLRLTQRVAQSAEERVGDRLAPVRADRRGQRQVGVQVLDWNMSVVWWSAIVRVKASPGSRKGSLAPDQPSAL